MIDVIVGICQIQLIQNLLFFCPSLWFDRSVIEGFVLLIHDAEDCLVDVGCPCGMVQQNCLVVHYVQYFAKMELIVTGIVRVTQGDEVAYLAGVLLHIDSVSHGEVYGIFGGSVWS